MDNISVVGILVAAIAFFFLGAVWYTFLFGKMWRSEMGITEEEAAEASPNPLMFVLSLVASLAIGFTLAKLIGDEGRSYGLKVGAGVGAGIGAALLAQNYTYEMRSVKFWLINAGYVVLGLAIMGNIIGVFQS